MKRKEKFIQSVLNLESLIVLKFLENYLNFLKFRKIMLLKNNFIVFPQSIHHS